MFIWCIYTLDIVHTYMVITNWPIFQAWCMCTPSTCVWQMAQAYMVCTHWPMSQSWSTWAWSTCPSELDHVCTTCTHSPTIQSCHILAWSIYVDRFPKCMQSMLHPPNHDLSLSDLPVCYIWFKYVQAMIMDQSCNYDLHVPGQSVCHKNYTQAILIPNMA